MKRSQKPRRALSEAQEIAAMRARLAKDADVRWFRATLRAKRKAQTDGRR